MAADRGALQREADETLVRLRQEPLTGDGSGLIESDPERNEAM
jgi:hypothetical protein